MTLQQQVQQHLDSTGISLRELSRRSGVSHTTISKILRGGTYKSDTANDLVFAMSFYGGDTARPVMQSETLHDKVEQLAADRVDYDKGAWDVDLQCAKYRRVMQLEKELEQTKAEVGVWRKKADKAGLRASELDLLVQRRDAELSDEKRNFAALEQVHEQREQHLKSCENALIEAHTELTAANQKLSDANAAYLMLHAQHSKQEQQLSDAQDKLEYMKRLAGEDGQKIRERDSTILDLDARMDAAKAEIKRLTALSEMHGQSWKAACVQVEQLQKQLDHGQVRYNDLYKTYSQQVDDEREMLAQIDTLFTERDNMRTEYEYRLMRLRVRCFALVCAIVFLIVSGLVLWGAV